MSVRPLCHVCLPTVSCCSEVACPGPVRNSQNRRTRDQKDHRVKACANLLVECDCCALLWRAVELRVVEVGGELAAQEKARTDKGKV